MAKYDGVYEGRLPRALKEYVSRAKTGHGLRSAGHGRSDSASGLLAMMKKWLLDTDWR